MLPQSRPATGGRLPVVQQCSVESRLCRNQEPWAPCVCSPLPSTMARVLGNRASNQFNFIPALKHRPKTPKIELSLCTQRRWGSIQFWPATPRGFNFGRLTPEDSIQFRPILAGYPEDSIQFWPILATQRIQFWPILATPEDSIQFKALLAD